MTNSTQRDRRSTEIKLTLAVEALILEEGFGAIGVNALARRAGVDKVLIYRYFGGLPGLLAAYGEHGDFWWQVEDLMAEPLADGGDLRELPNVLSVLFRRHVDFLRRHPVTLEVIAWEMSDRNELTEALEAVRESRSLAVVRRVAERFDIDDTGLSERISPIFALLGAAANYLAVRGRRLRTFNGIDLQTDQGWATLNAAAEAMITGALRPGSGSLPIPDSATPAG